jgi:transposase
MGAMLNKTGRNDARAIAQIMRTGWFRAVHVKTSPCRSWRSLLVARRTVLNEMRPIENVVRAILREPGLKPGTPARKDFVVRAREPIGGEDGLARMIEPLLTIPGVMLREFARLTKQVLDAVRNKPVWRRLMSAPGAGPMTALAFRAAIDRPERFRKSRDAGAHLGLTPRRSRSGATDVQGRVSRCGGELACTALHEAAHFLLVCHKKWPAPRAWGMKIAKRRGMARARVAATRKLAAILHRMWAGGAGFRFGSEKAAAAGASKMLAATA